MISKLFSALSAWFRRALSSPTFKMPPIVVINPPAPEKVFLPYPEEMMTLGATMTNINLNLVLQRWVENYRVPQEQRDFWFSSIKITLDDKITYPAGTWEANGTRYMVVRPEWLNPGVVAHEMAHCSYALLTPQEKDEFNIHFTLESVTNKMVQEVINQHPYATQTDVVGRYVEGHAEIYRYLGDTMPDNLKKYYPRLMK